MGVESSLKKKWKLIKPKNHNGFYYVVRSDYDDENCCTEDSVNKCHCSSGEGIVTVYGANGKQVGLHLIKLHNAYIDNLKEEVRNES